MFDRPIGANQAITHPLAKAHMELGAAFTMMQLAAWRYDHGLECGEEANTAKYLAAEACFFAADRRCRPTAASATPSSTTSSATGARPACSASRRSARR